MQLVARGDDFQDPNEPPLRIGDVVQLNSGGPPLLVVDLADGLVTTAWKAAGVVREHAFPRLCVHRCRSLW